MRRLFAALLALPLCASAAPINLVKNGSFESDALANGQWKVYAAASNSSQGTTQALTGWRLSAGSGVELRRNVAGSAEAGLQYVELDSFGNSAIEQSFLALPASGHFDLSFWYAPRIGQGPATNGIEVLWNGVSLTPSAITGDGRNSAVHQWAEYRFAVDAIAGPNTLGFRAVGTSDSLGGSLDNVSLVQRVPEPQSLALLAVAAAVAGLGRTRRRAR